MFSPVSLGAGHLVSPVVAFRLRFYGFKPDLHPTDLFANLANLTTYLGKLLIVTGMNGLDHGDPPPVLVPLLYTEHYYGQPFK